MPNAPRTAFSAQSQVRKGEKIMNADVVEIAALDSTLRQQWVDILTAESELDSPFLHPAFCEAADGLLGKVYVAVFRESHQPVGFLPFQKQGAAAYPVALGLNEQQAVVAGSDWQWLGADLLKACRLKSYHFDQLLGGQAEAMGGWLERVGGSPQADLSNGFDAYIAARKRAGSSTVRETMRKRRKLEREVGAVRFQWHNESEEVFETLIDWKRRQHCRTGVYDLFQNEDVVEFLHAVSQAKQKGFRGRTSVLYVNEQPVAIHLGLFTDSMGHLWYPAYDTNLSLYSPGLILLLEMMSQMPERGLQTLDFGPRPQRYKTSLQTCERGICQGVADRVAGVSTLRHSFHVAKSWAKSTPLKLAARPWRWAFRFRKWLSHSFA